MNKRKLMKTGFIGNYLPRKCGIATFTSDLETAVKNELQREDSTFAVAMNNIPEGYDYPEKVKKTIYQHNRKEYIETAQWLNESDADIICIQHEFGIFGGSGGEYIVDLMRYLKKPIVVTLHTILKEPPEPLKSITKEMANLAHGLVVMSEKAVGYLEDNYGIPPEKVRMIHHGVPTFGFSDPLKFKDDFGFNGHTVLGTFGLLSRNKGIEYVIKQLPKVVDKHPDLLYVVLGETHPEVKKHEGESYRESLEQMADDLGVGNNIRFISKFVDIADLVKFLQTTDIYITPYQGREQITSGTLAYALAAGNAIISTPYWYAQELLDDGRGVLINFDENNDISNALNKLLDNPSRREEIRQKAFKFGRRMTWPQVAARYIEYFKEAQKERIVITVPYVYSEIRNDRRNRDILINVPLDVDRKLMDNESIPSLNMSHMRVLTDDTGIIQHAIYSVPDRKTGYCIDDNSRALIAAVRAWQFLEDKSNMNLAKTYLSFIHYAQLEDGRFHNFMNYERKFIDDGGSEDSYGRTMWALGYLIERAPKLGDIGVDRLAQEIFQKALPNARGIISPRAWAYTMLGFHHYLKRFPNHDMIMELMEDYANRIVSLYKAFSSEKWKWFEGIISYDNGKLPQVLYHASAVCKNQEYFNIAQESLDFLTDIVFDNDIFMPIGTEGWYKKGSRKAQFDQQPIEGSSMIDVYLTAANHPNTPSGKSTMYENLAVITWEWFMSRNALEIPLYDTITGACADGLCHNEASLNQGAESTISAVMALQSIRENLKSKIVGQVVSGIEKTAKKGEKKSKNLVLEAN